MTHLRSSSLAASPKLTFKSVVCSRVRSVVYFIITLFLDGRLGRVQNFLFAYRDNNNLSELITHAKVRIMIGHRILIWGAISNQFFILPCPRLNKYEISPTFFFSWWTGCNYIVPLSHILFKRRMVVDINYCIENHAVLCIHNIKYPSLSLQVSCNQAHYKQL